MSAQSGRSGHQQVFEELVALFDSARPGDVEASDAAAALWIGYPLWCEMIECDDRLSDDEKFHRREDVAHLHFRAVEALMREANRWGLDPAPLAEEARVCREIFQSVRQNRPPSETHPVRWFHHRHRVSDHWPDCLGEWRLSLPPVFQEAIRQGEGEFCRLVVKLDAEETGTETPLILNATRKIEQLTAAAAPQYVGLDQIAAMAGQSKDTLSKKKNAPHSTMPSPDIEGGGGRKDFWKWPTVLPWLRREYPGRAFPDRFPTLSPSETAGR